MQDITPEAIIIGVDSHKDVHVAVAINGLGARLATASFPVTSRGYRQLAVWAAGHGVVHAVGIEGTGSYGAGLARALTEWGLCVVEVGRVNRQLRRRHGKTDTVDAESAARSVLAGDADGQPKSGEGAVEMIRHLKIAGDTALKARTQAMVTLKTLLVNAPQALRERFIGITGKMTFVRAIAALPQSGNLSQLSGMAPPLNDNAKPAFGNAIPKSRKRIPQSCSPIPADDNAIPLNGNRFCLIATANAVPESAGRPINSTVTFG